MMRTISICSIWLSMIAVLTAEPLQKKVLIIGIDGTRVDALAVAKTPNLNAMKTNGCFTDRAINHPVTHSAACWSSMFTGVWGDKHGVNDPGNSFAGNRFDIYPSFFKRLKTANSNLNTVAYARWADLMTIVPDAGTRQSFASDPAIVTATTNLLLSANPDVFYTILLDVDSAGHSYGFSPTAPNYVKAIETADTQVGQIMRALTNRVSYSQEDWLVIVMSDHGAHDGTVPEIRFTFHLCWGPSTARGTIYPAPNIVDVCATVLTHMGVVIDPAWNLDARVEGFPLQPIGFGTNLIFNGNAESNSGTNSLTPNRGVAWWSDVTSLSLGCYGSNAAFPAPSSPGSTNRGNNFFLGDSASGCLTQVVNISAISNQIDALNVEYRLAGFFGGLTNRNDTMSLACRWVAADGTLLKSNLVGAVTAANRTNITGLLERSISGLSPTGARRVELILSAIGPAGANYGFADDLSLVLTYADRPPANAIACVPYPGSVGLEFDARPFWIFRLERSPDLGQWTELSGSQVGGGRIALTDANPISDKAFYRIKATPE